MKVDLRNKLEFNLEELDNDNSVHLIKQNYSLQTILDGNQIGKIDFLVVEEIVDPNEEVFEEDLINNIYINFMQVESLYRNLGIGTKLYEELGRLYLERWNNYPVGRNFMNPIAEYSFKKAVSLGLVPEGMLTEDKITRDYQYGDEELWEELKQKLPEKYQSRLKDVRRINS